MPADRRPLSAAKLVEAIGAEVTLLDGEANIITSTAASRRALGYDETFWRERNVLDLAHPDDVARARDALGRILDSPGGSTLERFRARHAEGHWETIEIHCTNLLDDPDVGALVVTTRAVTEEESLRTAHEEALRLASAQAEYVASVSHELRSPLQGILGVAQLLEAQLSGEPGELLAVIRDEASRLRRVIDDILDHAKVSSGKMALEPKPTELRRLAYAVADIVRPQLARSVKLDIAIAADVERWVLVDDLRLHQVLLNLTANAARFTTHGSITLRCRRQGPDRIAFAVEDTGTGIAPDVIDSVLEPFQQGVPSSRHAGTGLGLSISSELIALMGGRLEVESAPGVGSSFTFTVRAPAAAGPGAETDTRAGVAFDGGRARALVVDDNEVNRMVIGRQLESMGFVVDRAGGGADGAAMARVEPYDVIIMDWHMPGMDGLEAIGRIRADEMTGSHRSPIIAMTASAMAGDRERCLRAGADGFVAKPATRAELAEAVADLVDVDRAGDVASPAPIGPGPDPAAAARAVSDSVLEDLVRQLDDRAAVSTVVETYLRDLDARCATIVDAVASGATDVARREAHTLKSSSQLLGAAELGRLCHDIESGAAEPSPEVGAEVERTVEATRIGLTDWMNRQREAAT